MAQLRAQPSEGLAGTTLVPGDKSISHRALMLSSLAVGESRIEGLLEGEDVLATATAMAALGAELQREAAGRWRVWGRGIGGLAEPDEVLDLGNSGTAARLLIGLLASHPLTAVITGDASLRQRPMGRVIEPLSRIGARFTARAGGRLPLTLQGAADPLPIHYELPVASAQVKSAVLLAGLNTPGETTVVEPVATRDHSERMLAHFGAKLRIEDEPERPLARRITLVGQPELTAQDIAVPGDPSSAAFPVVAAALLPGSNLTIQGVGLNPQRTGLFTTLEEMGAQIDYRNRRQQGGEEVADLVVRGGPLTAVRVPPERAPSMIDEYPILAVAAAVAEGRSEMTGLAELRVKESDRLSATLDLLTACGISAEAGPDSLTIDGVGGRVPGGNNKPIATQLDHRIAMAALVLGLAAEQPVLIDDGTPIATSFPDFLALMNGLGADIRDAA